MAEESVLGLPTPARVFDFDGDRAEKRIQKEAADALILVEGGRYIIRGERNLSVEIKITVLIEAWCLEFSMTRKHVRLASPEWGPRHQSGQWFESESVVVIDRLKGACWNVDGSITEWYSEPALY